MGNSHDSNEPVAWLIDNDYTTVFRDIAEAHRNKGAKVEPLYTSPQSKPWVGLTEQEFLEAMDLANYGNDRALWKAIETKLKDKNGY